MTVATRTPICTIAAPNRTTYLVRYLPTGAVPHNGGPPVTRARVEFFNADQADDTQVGPLGSYQGGCSVNYLIERLDLCDLSDVFAVDYSNIPGDTAQRAAVWARRQRHHIGDR